LDIALNIALTISSYLHHDQRKLQLNNPGFKDFK